MLLSCPFVLFVIGSGGSRGCTVLNRAPRGRSSSAGTPSVRGIVTCQRVQSAPRQILVHKQVNSGDKKKLQEQRPRRESRNNNCFYSTHEGQINTFLSQQIKMNNRGQAGAVATSHLFCEIYGKWHAIWHSCHLKWYKWAFISGGNLLRTATWCHTIICSWRPSLVWAGAGPFAVSWRSSRP